MLHILFINRRQLKTEVGRVNSITVPTYRLQKLLPCVYVGSLTDAAYTFAEL